MTGYEMNGEEGLPTDPSEISDEMLADALADPDVRDLLERSAESKGGDLSKMTVLEQKALLLATLHVIAEVDVAEALGVTPELVEAIFADPEAQPLLEEAMSELEIEGKPADLDDEAKMDLVLTLVDAGAIELNFDDD